jgi:sugar lactone lactonase YvrE
VDVLLDDLQFANGVLLVPDAVVVAETGGYRLTRFWLTGARAGQRTSSHRICPATPSPPHRT